MEDMCRLKHDKIESDIARHESILKNHSERLDKSEQFQSRSEVMIDNLCNQLESLIGTLKWGFGLCFTTLLGFLIWYIQKL